MDMISFLIGGGVFSVFWFIVAIAYAAGKQATMKQMQDLVKSAEGKGPEQPSEAK